MNSDFVLLLEQFFLIATLGFGLGLALRFLRALFDQL